MSRRNTFADAVESVKNKNAIKNGYKITFLPWRRRVNLILPLSYHQILVKRLLDIKKNTNVRGSHGHPCRSL